MVARQRQFLTAIRLRFKSREPGFVDPWHGGIQSERDPVDHEAFALRRQTDAGLRVDLVGGEAPLSQAKEKPMVKQAACAAARIFCGLVPRRSSSNRLAKP